MQIIGAGMAGLLAGQYFRSHDPVIIEKQDSLPNNHQALLRFRSEAVSDLTGIKFKQANVQKLINYKEKHFTEASLYLNNLYSYKVAGGVYSRSLLNTRNGSRWIAPPNFISRVSKGLNIVYGQDAKAHVYLQAEDSSTPMISTMPLEYLAEMLHYDLRQVLETKEIWTFTFVMGMNIDVYQTVYYPNPTLPMYRLSITGNKVIAEFNRNPDTYDGWGRHTIKHLLHFLEIDFGIPPEHYTVNEAELKYQEHGKLVPGDRDEIHAFIGWATKECNIYSLGRWATHRQILMDDVVADIKVISNLIESKGYKR